MTDITTLTATDAIRWAATHSFEPAALMNLIDLGVTGDADLLLANERASQLDAHGRRIEGNLFAQAAVLVAARQPGDTFPAKDLLEHLESVGPHAFALDFQNLTAWVNVAEQLRALLAGLRTHTRGPDGTFVSRTTAGMISEFLLAGRTPTYAQAMTQAATDLTAAPDLFGYGPEIDADAFRALIGAGLTSASVVTVYRDAGFTSLDQIMDLAARAISPNSILAAITTGLPRDQWDRILPGLNPYWFPLNKEGDVARIFAREGMKWEALRFLADNGWFDLSEYLMDHGFAKRGTFGFTTEVAVAAATAGITVADLRKWYEAMTIGSNRGADGRGPLTRSFNFSTPGDLADMIALHRAGLRPAHINGFRNVGANSVAEILELVAVGVTVKRAKYLLDTFAVKQNNWSKKRLTKDRVLAVHASTPLDK